MAHSRCLDKLLHDLTNILSRSQIKVHCQKLIATFAHILGSQ